MFENFGTAVVQAIGFFGVFGFFIYRLLSEQTSSNSLKDRGKNNSSKSVKTVISEKKGLFGKRKIVEQNIEPIKKEKKKGWFKR